MTPKTHLFELIQSMSLSEIKAFKEYAGKRKKGGQAKYSQLFDTIRAMDENDESIIRKKFQGEKFLKNLSQAKAYLYGTILESLRESNRNESSQLHSYLEQILILKDKSFFHHTPPLFQKSISLAEELEDFVIHIKLLQLQQDISRSSKPHSLFLKDLPNIEGQEHQIRAKENNLFQYRELLNQVYKAYGQSKGNRLKTITGVRKHPLMTDVSNGLSLTAKIAFLSIRYNLSRLEEDLKTAIEELENIISLLANQEKLLQSSFFRMEMIFATFNLGLLHIFFKNWAKAFQAIASLDTISKKVKRAKVAVFERRALLEISIARKKLDLELGLKVVREVEGELTSNFKRFHPNKIVELQYTIAEFFMNHGLPAKALPYINELRNAPISPHRPDLHLASWILFFIAHYEIGNYDTLESQLSMSREYFSKQGKMGLFERCFFKFIKHIIHIGDARSHKPQFSLLREEWTEAFASEKEAYKVNYFRYLTWIDAHLEGLAYEDYLRRNL